jgi:hypothetical protein
LPITYDPVNLAQSLPIILKMVESKHDNGCIY